MKHFFSVIIPLQELSYYLMFENLPAFQNQKYRKFEVIVLPNRHSQYDISLLKKYKWLKIIPTGKEFQPAGKRNIGIKFAKGDVVTFIDDDAFPKDDFLGKLNTVLTNKIDVVGGPGILPPHSAFWEKIFDEILKTWMGSAGNYYRFVKSNRRYVDDFPTVNFSIKKSFLLKLGGFRADCWPGEDSKLCEKIVYNEHKKIIYDPRVLVYHHRRRNLLSFLRQNANYGFHRGIFFAQGDNNSKKISYLIPSFFVFYLSMLLVVLGTQSIFGILKQNNEGILYVIYIPLVMYLILTFRLFFSSFFNTKNLLISFLSPLILFATHLIYGMMFVIGFLKEMKKRIRIDS